MNDYRDETALSIFGVPGRRYAMHLRPDRRDLFSAQKWVSERRPYVADGYRKGATIQAEIRFDDSCKNGHATFAITGEIREPGMRDISAGGCIHDDIAKAFPELAGLIKWHLTSTDGPMHYVANAIYAASNRDHNGLLKGEERQIINGRTKQPCWILTTESGDPVHGMTRYADGEESELPPVPVLKWSPMLRVGEGKERDLDAARKIAIWPDATDAELMADKAQLRAMLEARLPALLEAFRADMADAGLLWAPEGV